MENKISVNVGKSLNEVDKENRKENKEFKGNGGKRGVNEDFGNFVLFCMKNKINDINKIEEIYNKECRGNVWENRGRRFNRLMGKYNKWSEEDNKRVMSGIKEVFKSEGLKYDDVEEWGLKYMNGKREKINRFCF